MITKKPLSFWVLHHYRGPQVVLLGMILATIFFRVFPVEMQKRIINEAVAQGLEQKLFTYAALYLGAVVTASLLKYLINVLQGWIGQRLLLDIRAEFFRHVISLPLPFFRGAPAGMVISSITGELAAVGEFLGGAATTPVINILTLLAFAGYMVWLEPFLAFLSLAIYPLEMVFVPRLQRRYNLLNRKRIDATRGLSNVIGESVIGVHEVHANAGYGLEGRKFDGYSRRLFKLRQRMNVWNYGIKFANNFLQKVGPFLLFVVGGYQVIHGRLSLGALVAFLSAYDNLYDPWKDLMEYYQLYQDAAVRYRRVMEYFDVPSDIVPAGEGAPLVLSGAVEVRDLSYTAEGGARLLEGVSFTLSAGEQLALVGYSGSGKSTLALVLGQLYQYEGHVLLDGMELKSLPRIDVSRNVGFVSQAPFIFDGSVRDNLLYGVEALRPEALPDSGRLIDIVRKVGLEEDILRFGLNMRPARKDLPDSVLRAVLSARQRLRREMGEKLDELVETYRLDRYLRHADVYSNIVFGEADDPRFEPRNIPANASFLFFLRERGLLTPLLDLGAAMAEGTVDLLRRLGEDVFFRQSPILPEEIEEYSALVDRRPWRDSAAFGTGDVRLLIRLALRFVPALHAMAAMPPGLEADLLRARLDFMRVFGESSLACRIQGGNVVTVQAPDAPEPQDGGRGGFVFYCPEQYVMTRSLLENILYGQVRQDRPRALEESQNLAVEALAREGCLEDVLAIGLDFATGSKGDRLSGGQRQKVALARALLKEPRLLILDEATASLDNTSQAKVQQFIGTELRGRCTVVSVVHRLDIVGAYDRIAVIRAGRIVDMGTYEELMAREGPFLSLLRGEPENGA